MEFEVEKIIKKRIIDGKVIDITLFIIIISQIQCKYISPRWNISLNGVAMAAKKILGNQKKTLNVKNY